LRGFGAGRRFLTDIPTAAKDVAVVQHSTFASPFSQTYPYAELMPYAKADAVQNARWEVVHNGGVVVRSEMSSSSAAMLGEAGKKSLGMTVVGRLEGDWLALTEEPGFVLVSDGDVTFLREKAPAPSPSPLMATLPQAGTSVMMSTMQSHSSARTTHHELGPAHPDLNALRMKHKQRPSYSFGSSGLGHRFSPGTKFSKRAPCKTHGRLMSFREQRDLLPPGMPPDPNKATNGSESAPSSPTPLQA
jgi:hypothetical protein